MSEDLQHTSQVMNRRTIRGIDTMASRANSFLEEQMKAAKLLGAVCVAALAMTTTVTAQSVTQQMAHWADSGKAATASQSGAVEPQQDAAALEAQYKTCANHYIPADKCTPEIYRQLEDKYGAGANLARADQTFVTPSGLMANRHSSGPKQSALLLTNNSIVKLVKGRVNEDTIISVIKAQPGNYSLGAEDILALKRAGVSDKMITAMVNKSASGSSPAPVRAPVPTAGATELKKEDPATSSDRPGGERSMSAGQDPRIPNGAGLYTVGPGQRLDRIEGRVTSFIRSGSRLASAATLGIHANRVNTQIPGTHANVTVGPRPTFYYRPVEDQGGLDLIMTRLTVQNGRRQFEVGAQGFFRESKGVSVRHQLDFDAKEVEAGLYKIVLTRELEPGQYAFYLLRGREHSSVNEGSGFVYCFQVE
jgi:hypothetical protein